ncbi:polyribonucleotide nucleotidyltransferase [Desulfohalotomaculum tongense]|uniref:polyribonucleotide nucleotidyltransferase n=1 Tax=Desulforadius tongensis TaxID=1216062 RepID=UPI00195764E2|nr:polyribonucleotide nucleotidyltransferase [Desulforadius tongensis]MBM7854447.1 polyribonucleotide nucleotidyltransferase [Desulforadius tongensis]
MSEQNVLRKEISLGGRTLTLETGRVAKQAGGAVLVRYGDTVVLVTATMSKNPREGIDFFPLTVDYEERHYAVGKIPGGFIKREGRPSEKATLSARLIDRPIRPLFNKKLRNEVQVIATVLSVDQSCAPEITAMIGASAALHISNIPFQGPIGGVIVGRVDGEFVINPTIEQHEKSEMHLVVAGTKDAVMMVEAGANEVPEDIMLDGIMFGHEVAKEIVQFIEQFRAEALAMGLAKEKIEVVEPEIDPALEEKVSELADERYTEAIRRCARERMPKKEREAFLEEVAEGLVADLTQDYSEEELAEKLPVIKELIHAQEKKVMRRMIIEEKVRIDGRAINEVRPISVEVGILPRTHGTGLFTRGQTQILSVATLGRISEEQILDGLEAEDTKRYMHHYNFPPYSTGETKMMRSPGRREIGHGALAERALVPVLPAEEEFPYTIRVVSEALESNGSTSMGSVCGSTLALMDAGVKIKAPVSGVAMGLIKEDDNFIVLTDIQGIEDALGDMDFKVAGTARGVTALQMDIKIPGITKEVFRQALAQAHEGRMHILNKMLEVISEPRKEISPYAPAIISMQIDPDKIRDVIGPGGKIIKRIVDETGADIDIEDDGRIFISAVNREAGKKAMEYIEKLTRDVEPGEILSGRVVKVTDFGAFVEVVPGIMGMQGKEGLVHISQLAYNRVEKVEDVVKEGDVITVKVLGYDDMGRLKLSKKDAMEPPEGYEEEKRRFKKGSRKPRTGGRRFQ